ncbi:MAG: ABC transporter ATP-binding protein [Actinomycetota bacterium]|nr:ABC transporter ATP-binding protein [Actinomycetota bacterium]
MTTAESHGLEITGLTKKLGENTVVKGISLSVRRGELVCLLGPSGCGKTTTLRMIGGFLQPDGGRIAIDGRDVTELPPERRPTAMVFQNYALWPHMTVYKNVAYGLRLRKLAKSEIDDRVAAALKMVNLDQKANRHPGALSGGEQQRVALARAIVLEPALLLLDEPLSNLDAKLRVGVREEIREIQQRLSITTVFVTHDQDEALSVADRIAVMSSGDIEQYSDPDDLYRHPESRFVAGFVGAMNIFEGRVTTGGVLVGAEDAFLPCAEGVLSGLRAEAGNLELAVRLEDVSVAPASSGGPSGGAGRVVRQVPHGHFKEVLIELGKQASLRAYVDPDVDLSGPVAVTVRRLLAYRDGELVYSSHARDQAGRRSEAAAARVESAR